MTDVKMLNDLLEHIKEVELNVIALSKTAHLNLSSFIEKNSIVLDDEMLESMQYQDIISQQLSATIEALENIQTTLQDSSNTDENLKMILTLAKEKQSAFSGNTTKSDDDEIEFF